MSLPIPTGSDFSPPSKMSKESNTTTKDQVSCFHAPAEAKTRNSDFYALNPDTLQALRESHESSFIFRNITPSDFTDWEALYPELYEADNTRYEYDGFAERMIVKCMAGPVRDSFSIFFIRAVHDGLDRTGRECRRGLQISATTGGSRLRLLRCATCINSMQISTTLRVRTPTPIHASFRMPISRWRARAASLVSWPRSAGPRAWRISWLTRAFGSSAQPARQRSSS